MADVSIWVPVITAGAGIIGATIPQVTTVIRDTRQAERDRRERSATMTRNACVALLRSSGEVRALSETIYGYRGATNGMMEKVEQLRNRAEEARVHAAEVSMQVIELAKSADELADAASGLVDEVVRNLDQNQGVLLSKPDAAELVKRIDAFRGEAVQYAKK